MCYIKFEREHNMEKNNKIKDETAAKDFYVQDDRFYKIFDESKSVADILNEALNLARVEETGIRIPNFIELTSIDGRWALITKNVKGKNMAKLLEENPDKEDELLNRFVDIQIDIQNRKCPLLSRHIDKMNRKIAQTDLSATLRYDLHNRIESMPRHLDLCHGDYNPSNVVISEDDEAYIVDWTHATQGNAEADAARTFLLFLLDDKKKRAGKYLTLYCEKKGCSYKDVLAWLPILAASQSVKGFKNESAFLHSLIFMDDNQLEELYER